MLVIGQEEEDLLSRKVSLNMRDTSIEEILKAIETDDFAFTYSAEIFDVKKRVTIRVANESIKSVLETLFQGQNMECQQMGNKLLIRKKRVPQKSVSKLDTAKEKTASEVSKTPPVQSPISEITKNRNEQTKVGEEKQEKPDSTTLKKSLVSTNGNSISESSEIANLNNEQYYKEERRRIAELVATYESREKKSLIFVPIYLPKPKGLAPLPIHINIAPEEAPKEEKKPRVKKEQPSDKKFRINIASNVGYAEIGTRDAVIIGGQLAYNPTKNFGIGVAGKGFITRNEPDAQLGLDYVYSGGYGGLLLEATLFPNQPFHLSFPVIFGLGSLAYNSLDKITGLNTIEDERTIFVFEPSAYLEMNIIKYLRVGFGVSYRDASSSNLKYKVSQDPLMDKDGLDGLSINVMVKFGLF